MWRFQLSADVNASTWGDAGAQVFELEVHVGDSCATVGATSARIGSAFVQVAVPHLHG